MILTERSRPRRLRPRSAVSLVSIPLAAALLVFLLAASAHAHGDEAMVPARTSVLQAIAYIVNSPQSRDPIGDKLKDASEAEDASGVDKALLGQAQEALNAGNLAKTRQLLQRSIGASPDLTGTDVRPVLLVPKNTTSLRLATAEESGTQVVTDEMPGRRALSGFDYAFLAAALVLAGTGLVLARRFRPPHSIHNLRHRPSGTRPGPPGA